MIKSTHGPILTSSKHFSMKNIPSRHSMRRAFTLIELLISIMILSIMMVFLYKSYASLNKSNSVLKEELATIQTLKMKRKSIFLDFSVSLGTVNIISDTRSIDTVLLQSSHSTHRRFNPYIAYIVKQNKLYRLESLKKLSYPLDVSSEFDVDEMGEVTRFRVFENKKKNAYIVDVVFKNKQKILLKIKALNKP